MTNFEFSTIAKKLNGFHFLKCPIPLTGPLTT